jgi:serine protease Do
MTPWRTAALVMGLVAAGGAGAILPAAHQDNQEGRDRLKRRAFDLHVNRGGGQIGVSIRDLDDDDLKRAKLSSPGGVLVEEVEEDSAAQKAGVKTGDVIVEFDGERVRGTRQFIRLVQETPLERQAQATIVRDGQRMTLSIVPREGDAFRYLRELPGGAAWVVPPTPPTPPAPARPAPAPFAFDFDGLLVGSGGHLGIAVGDLSSQLAEYFGTKEGVLVTSVRDNSSAAKAGLKAGDVITSFNGARVSSPSDLRRRIDRVDYGEEFTIEVVRDKKAMTLKGKLEDRTERRRTTRTIV